MNERAKALANRIEVGERIRELRKIRGRSQSDISSHLGITQASLSNYETGKRDLPLSTAVKLAAELDVPFGDVLQTKEMIVLRDSRLGKAMRTLADSPELLQAVIEGRILNIEPPIRQSFQS